jgi:DNA polymerase
MERKTEMDPDRAVRAVIDKLESLERAGVTHLRKPPVVAATEGREAPSGPVAGDVNPNPKPTRGAKKQAATLDEISQQVAACTRCAELVRSRTQTVFGVGNPRARLVFLGEAPGADEDRQGEPFVGRAGKLLTDIIEKGMKLRRQDVYILNILKCRPPGNRNPLADEAANCREYLDAQLSTIQPEFICCLGAVAARNLLDTTAPIGKLRGRFFVYQDYRVMCTYHPAYVLRYPEAKRQVWEDIQMLMAEMGLEVPRK